MLIEQQNAKRALLQARALFGTTEKLVEDVEISANSLNKTINHPTRKINLNIALQLSAKSGTDLDILSPSTKKSNHIIEKKRTDQTISLPLKSIVVRDFPGLGLLASERPMIVGTDGVLISGRYQLEAAKAKGLETVKVIVLDLETLYEKGNALKTIFYDFLIIEEFEIAHRFESAIGNHPGLRNDLGPNRKKVKKQKTSEPPLPEDPLKLAIVFVCEGRKDLKVSKVIGRKPSSYYCGMHILHHGIPELRDAVNREKISLSKACDFSKLLIDEQSIELQKHLQGDTP